MTQLHTFSRDSSFPVQSRHDICQGIRLSSFSAVLAVGSQANRRTHNAAQEAGTVRTWGTLCTEARARHMKAKINQEYHHPLLRTLLLHAFSPHELLQPWQSGLTKCTTQKKARKAVAHTTPEGPKWALHGTPKRIKLPGSLFDLTEQYLLNLRNKCQTYGLFLLFLLRFNPCLREVCKSMLQTARNACRNFAVGPENNLTGANNLSSKACTRLGSYS